MNDLLQTLIAALLPTLMELGSLALMGVLMWVSNVARKRWGIEIEARHREALHSGLMSGIEAALARGLGQNEAIAYAIQHAKESVPDAVTALKPKPEVLQRIAEAKLQSRTTIQLPTAPVPQAA